MIPFEYIVLVFALILLGLALVIKEWMLGIISGMLFVLIGLHMAVNGIVDTNNWMTQSFSIIVMGTGFYVMIKGSLDKINTYMDGGD